MKHRNKLSPYLKSVNTQISNVIDADTGEMIKCEVKKHTILTDSKEEFLLLYVNCLPVFMKLSNPAKTVYAYLLYNYSKTSHFEVGAASRNYIAEKIEICSSAVANALTELKDHRFIISLKRGIYCINPEYAFQGSSSNRRSALKALLEIELNEK